MAVAAWLVWDRLHGAAFPALKLLRYQLGLNVLWSILFFTLRNPDAAATEVLVLWLVLGATTVSFLRIHRVAGILHGPLLGLRYLRRRPELLDRADQLIQTASTDNKRKEARHALPKSTVDDTDERRVQRCEQGLIDRAAILDRFDGDEDLLREISGDFPGRIPRPASTKSGMRWIAGDPKETGARGTFS